MMDREKQRNRFLFACFLCVLVPLLLGSVTYTRTCELLKQNAIELNTTMLENARDLSDMQYEEIDMLCSQLYISVGNSQILHAENLAPFDMQMKKMELIKSIAKLMQSVNYVDTYYVYLQKLNLIITEDSVYADPVLYYTNNLLGDEAMQEAWLESLTAPRRFLTARAETFAGKQGYKNSITFYRSFPYIPYDDPQGCIALTFSQDEMKKPFEPLTGNDSAYRVVDESGGVLFGAGVFPVSVEEVSPGEMQIRDENGDRYSIVSIVSPVSGWRFDTATNTTQLFSAMNVYRHTYFTLTVIILLVGIAVSGTGTFRAMKPVNLLIDRSSKLEQRVTQQTEVLSAVMWEKLLTGELSDEEQILRMLDMSGMHARGTAWVAVDIRTAQELPGETVDALAQRLGVHAYQPKPTEVMLCVPLRSAVVDAHQLMERVRNALDGLKLTGRIGMGKACDSLTLFYQSYFEAETALTYARSAGLPCARYEDVGGITEYLRPLAGVGDQLLQAVLSGQMDEVSKCLDWIRAETFDGNRQGYFVRMQIIYELRHIVIRSTRVLPDEHELDQELLSSLSRQSIRENPQMEFDNLCTTLLAIAALREQEVNREKPKMKSDDMLRYLSEHYQDPQLSLRTVAESFRMNENYFSTYFKQNTGVSFMDYLQQLRIDRAIDLIQQGKLKVTEIAQAVGYSNDQTFRRAFKRVIGVSPSAYRNACLGLPSDKEEQE